MLLRIVVCSVLCVLLCSGQFTRSRRLSTRGSSLADQRRTRPQDISPESNTTAIRPANQRAAFTRSQPLARIQRAPANSLQGLYDFLVKNGLNNLCKMLKQSDIERILLSVGSCTIFGPADETFAFLPGDLWRSFRKDSSKKREFLMGHVVPGTVSSADVRNDMLVNAAEGSPIRFNVYEHGKVWTASGAQVLQPDLRQGQYTVHVIDQFLHPPATMTNVDYVRGHFDNFYRMLAAADPNNFLAEGTFTLFVPGDEAFRALPEFLYEAIYNNNTLLQSILLNHIVPSTYYRVGLPLGGSLTSLDENLLRFKTRRGLVLVNGIPIFQPDISVTNGVIHVINRVVLPPNVFEDCNCIPTTPVSRRPTTFLPTTKPTTEQTLIFDEAETTPHYARKRTALPPKPSTERSQTTPLIEPDMTTENLQTQSTTDPRFRRRRPSFAPLTLPSFESSRINGNQDVTRQTYTTPLSTLADTVECGDGGECPTDCPDGQDCPESDPMKTEFPSPQTDGTKCTTGEPCTQVTIPSLVNTPDYKDKTLCSDGVDCYEIPASSVLPQETPLNCIVGTNCPDDSAPITEEPPCLSENNCSKNTQEVQSYPLPDVQCLDRENCLNTTPDVINAETPTTPNDPLPPAKVPTDASCPGGKFCPKFPEKTRDVATTTKENTVCQDGENCPESQEPPLEDVPPESLCPVGNFCPEQQLPVKSKCREDQPCPDDAIDPVTCIGPSCTTECSPGQLCPQADSPLKEPPLLSTPPEESEPTSTECKGGSCLPRTTTPRYIDEGEAKPNAIPSKRRKPSRKPPGFIRIPYGPLYTKTSPKPEQQITTTDKGSNVVTSPSISIFPTALTDKPPTIESRPQYGSENNPEGQPSSPVTDYTDSPYEITAKSTFEPDTVEKVTTEYSYQYTNPSIKPIEFTTEKSVVTTEDSSVEKELNLVTTETPNLFENPKGGSERPSTLQEDTSSPVSEETSPSDRTTDSAKSASPTGTPADSIPFETKGPFDFLDDITVTTELPTTTTQRYTDGKSTPLVTNTADQDYATSSSISPINKVEDWISTVNQNDIIASTETPATTQPDEQNISTVFGETKSATESEPKKTTIGVTLDDNQTTKALTRPDEVSEPTDRTPQPTDISEKPETEPNSQVTTERNEEDTTGPKTQATSEPNTEFTTEPKEKVTTELNKEITTETKAEVTTEPNEDVTTEPTIQATTGANKEVTSESKAKDTTSEGLNNEGPVPSESTTRDDEATAISNKEDITNEGLVPSESTQSITDVFTTPDYKVSTEAKISSTVGQTEPNTIETSTSDKNSEPQTTNVPNQDNPETTTYLRPTEQRISITESNSLPSTTESALPSSDKPELSQTEFDATSIKITEPIPERTTILSTITPQSTTSETTLPQTTTTSNMQTTDKSPDLVPIEVTEVPNKTDSTPIVVPSTPEPCGKPGNPCIQRRWPTRPPATDDVGQSTESCGRPGNPCIYRRRPTKPPKPQPDDSTTPQIEQDKIKNDLDDTQQSEAPEQITTSVAPITEQTSPKLSTLRARPTIPIIPYVTATESIKDEPTTQPTPKSESSPTRPTIPIIPYVTTTQESTPEKEKPTSKPETTTTVTVETTKGTSSTTEVTEDTGFYTDYTPTTISPQPEYQAPIPQIPELRPEPLDPTWNDKPPNSIEDVLNRPNLVIGKIPVTFHIVLKLFNNVGLTDILTRKGPYTLCVPTDAAFSLLPSGYLQRLQRNGELLRKILLHHVITSQLQVANLRNNYVIRTYQGLPVLINVLDAGKVVLIGGSRVLGTARTRNGVLYVTNRVFSVLPEYNLLRGIRNNPDLSHFYDYVINSPLKQVLRARGPFTLAAPTNDAFTQLSPDTLNMLSTNHTALEMVLYNHLTAGAHFTAGLTRDLILPTPRGGTLWFHISSGGLEINDARVVKADISCGNGVMHVTDKVLLSSQGIFERQNDYADQPQPTASFVSLSELANGLGVDTFVKWFETSGLLQKINDGGRYTILAPTEDALHALPPTTFQSLKENVNMLQQVLKYHVLQGFLQPTLLSNEETVPTLLPGKDVRFNWYKNDTELTVSGAKLGLDRRRDNVIVQVINRVLYPPAGDVMTTVSRSPLLQDLTRALRMTGMDKILSGTTRPYTLFAPTEEAFRNLPKSEYMSLFNSPQEMTRLLKRHLHEGTLFSSGVTNGMNLPSQSGEVLTITTKPQCIVVDGVNVLYSDITATNGVVHVLNHLL